MHTQDTLDYLFDFAFVDVKRPIVVAILYEYTNSRYKLWVTIERGGVGVVLGGGKW